MAQYTRNFSVQPFGLDIIAQVTPLEKYCPRGIAVTNTEGAEEKGVFYYKAWLHDISGKVSVCFPVEQSHTEYAPASPRC